MQFSWQAAFCAIKTCFRQHDQAYRVDGVQPGVANAQSCFDSRCSYNKGSYLQATSAVSDQTPSTRSLSYNERSSPKHAVQIDTHDTRVKILSTLFFIPPLLLTFQSQRSPSHPSSRASLPLCCHHVVACLVAVCVCSVCSALTHFYTCRGCKWNCDPYAEWCFHWIGFSLDDEPSFSFRGWVGATHLGADLTAFYKLPGPFSIFRALQLQLPGFICRSTSRESPVWRYKP